MPPSIPTVDFVAIDDEDIVRFDHADKTFAIYRVDDTAYASDGPYTHERVHLCHGLVMAHVIECPKHNGGPRHEAAPRARAQESINTELIDISDGVGTGYRCGLVGHRRVLLMPSA